MLDSRLVFHYSYCIMGVQNENLPIHPIQCEHAVRVLVVPGNAESTILCEYKHMECRIGCGACCIAPSISSPIPGMPHGKPAGMRCIQLSTDNRCLLFGLPERPAVCTSLRPQPEMCGNSAEEALQRITLLEWATMPLPGSARID